MSADITKFQKQSLGSAIRGVGYSTDDFVYTEHEHGTSGNGYAVTLTNRTTSESFTLYHYAGDYKVEYDVPGTIRKGASGVISWESVTNRLASWCSEVKREAEAVDPWDQEAENLANDDSYFTIIELPKVDHAVDESVDELKSLALKNGKKLEDIQEDLNIVSSILKKSARNSTKKEWVALFKGIIVEKLLDWGLQTELFQSVLHRLIDAVSDVAQLAEHVSRHLLP